MNGGNHLIRRREGSKNTTLHRDHLAGRVMIPLVGRAGSVREQQALVSHVVGVAHRRVHADVGRHAREDDVADAVGPQDEVKVCAHERSLAWLVDDGFSLHRRQLGDDLPTRLPDRQDTPAVGPHAADARTHLLAPPELVRWQVLEVPAVPLAGVHDEEARSTKALEQPLQRLNGLARGVEVVAHQVHVTTLGTEINLHVNDAEGRVVGLEAPIKRPLVRIGVDMDGARQRRRQETSRQARGAGVAERGAAAVLPPSPERSNLAHPKSTPGLAKHPQNFAPVDQRDGPDAEPGRLLGEDADERDRGHFPELELHHAGRPLRADGERGRDLDHPGVDVVDRPEPVLLGSLGLLNELRARVQHVLVQAQAPHKGAVDREDNHLAPPRGFQRVPGCWRGCC
mmetsp:Transcript_27437/g.67718  ORF Transcript_27437/g.67718 Transcript_27437/m.67718 type:complete len:398 (-) Transcript_27437:29-1222(-)